jgi:hypothetical protein
MKAKWLALFLVAAGGCDTTNNTIVQAASPDMAGFKPPLGCTPMAKECVTGTLARICPSDGSNWLAVQCQFGETCMNGDCTVDVATVQCTSNDDFCADATTQMLCNTNGMGFHSQTCPTGTKCIQGLCAGSCVVGATQCDGTGTVVTCNDGFHMTPSACPAGQACSDQAGGVCAAAACTPGFCTALCGDKSMDPNNSDPGFFSTCQDTPFGFQWVATPCTAPKTCDATAACNSGGSNSCTEECTPGDKRCVDVSTNLPPATSSDQPSGFQDCLPSGTWSATTGCDILNGKSCVVDFAGRTLGCGDAICSQDFDGLIPHRDGVCVIDAGLSKLRACDATTGNLVPIDRLTTCSPGTCLTDESVAPDPFNGFRPGHCAVQCQMGDTRCDTHFQQDIQGCATNGMWSSTTTICTDTCFDGTSAGRPHAVCGVCQPKDTRCTTMGGVEVTDPSTTATIYTETCKDDAQWASPSPCAGSHCDFNPTFNFPQKLCLAQCIPGKVTCQGTKNNVPPWGFTATGICTSDGRPSPAPFTCTGGTSCRTGPNHTNAYGCVVCANFNEAGMPDTRCNTAPTPDQIEVCNATNTAYVLQNACSAVAAICVEQDDPLTFSAESCALTESDIKSIDPTNSCDLAFAGTPISCGGKPDCCSSYCTAATNVSPAVCL